jgi:hypothetical protein
MALVATLDGTNDYSDTETSGNGETNKSATAESGDAGGSEKGKEPKSGSEKDAPTVESLARELGWIPKEEFKWKPDDYVDAATYILKSKDVISSKNTHIGTLKTQIKEISNVVNELKVHNDRVYKADVKRLEGELETLRKERKVAISDGDVDKVEEIEKKIGELHADASGTLDTANKKDTAKTPDGSDNPKWILWQKDNSWYGTDDDMTKFADKFAEKYDGAPFERVLELVREEAERVFPDKFPEKDKSESRKTAINPVEPGTRKATSKTRFTKADLSASQKAIMGKFVRQGVMSEEEYIKDLAKMGELS